MEDLKKIISDFCQDIKNTFPEYNETVDGYNMDELVEYCKNFFTERTLEIVYKNEKIFEKECFFLPNIDFKTLWENNISDMTKETIWKYLQLILFSFVSTDDHSFSDTIKFFEELDKNDFKEKIEDIMSNLKGDDNFASSSLPDEDKLNSTFDGLFKSKIGSIAQEIAEETSKNLEIDPNANVMDSLLNNPSNLMTLVKSVSESLDKKMKNGDISQEELLKESSGVLNNMGGDFQKIFSSLGMNNLVNNMQNIDKNKAKQNLSRMSTRERLKQKLEKRKLLEKNNK